MEITFDNEVHDFGRVKKGDDVTHVFKFTNTGSEDVILELVSGCECSEIVYEEGGKYKPGEKGEIKVTFHSFEEKLGKAEKVLDILLENINPANGYQYILELKYTAIIY